MDTEENIRENFLEAAYGLATAGFSIEEAKIMLEAQYQIETEDPDCAGDIDGGEEVV